MECDTHIETAMDPLDKSRLHFTDQVYSKYLVNGFNELWKNKVLTDVVISVTGRDFQCHKSVLAASSTYFRAMFTSGMKESNLDRITLDCLEPVAMEAILQYIYTSEVEVRKENVQPLLQAASLFHFPNLMEACASFLQGELEASNCVGIYQFALLYSCQNLAKVSKHFILKNFTEVSTCAEFSRLSAEQLQELLMDRELIFLKGEHLFNAIQKWLNHDFDVRKRCLGRLSEALKAKGYNRTSESSWHLINMADQVKSSLIPAWQNFSIMRDDENNSESVSYEIIACFGNAWAGSQDRQIASYAVKFYDPVSKQFSGFHTVPSVMATRDYVTACLCGDKVIIGLRTGKFTSYDTKQGTWEVLSKYLVTPQSGNTMASIGDSLYICGKDGRFYAYDVARKQLESKSDLLCPVRCPSLVTVNQKIYVFGGKTRGDLHTDGTNLVQCYDPENNQWKLCCPIPEKCVHIAAAVLNGLIYIIGAGCYEHLKSTKKVLRYNPTTDSWCRIADLNKSRQSCDAVVCNGQMYVTGGYDVISDNPPKDSPVKEIECYDTVGDMWHVVDSLPIDIAFHCCFSLPVSKTKPVDSTKVDTEE
ncbi:kelch-like protein 24a [Ptychodera flava]|uniref:kelch-like protein 24a n=1 Tax=Ptychodera flava TaxID=63121 RepID=UPI00396A8B78